MDPVLGRTVSQIKNRFYQNLKGKDLSKIKYKEEDDESPDLIQNEDIEPDCEIISNHLVKNKRISKQIEKESVDQSQAELDLEEPNKL